MTKSVKLTIQSNFRGLASFIVLSALLIFCAHSHVQAASGAGPVGIQISPVTIEVQVDPGQVYTFKVSPFNVTNSGLELTPQVNDFKAKDESGTPEVLLDGSLPASSSLKSWITLSDPSPFQLASKQARSVIATMRVPKDAEAGGHYGIVRFSAAGVGQAEHNVSLIASTGTLLLVRVSGTINEKLSVASFYTSRHGVKSSLFEKAPINFTERINNTGNVHVKPQGNLSITNMFGAHVASVAINSGGGNVLPSSIRRFDQSLNKSHLIGRYRATFRLAYGTHGQILSSSLSFWVIPYKLIGVTILGLAVLILLIIWTVKRYNRKIIQRALKRS